MDSRIKNSKLWIDLNNDEALVLFDRLVRFYGKMDPPFILEREANKGPGSVPIVPRKPEPWELPHGYE